MTDNPAREPLTLQTKGQHRRRTSCCRSAPVLFFLWGASRRPRCRTYLRSRSEAEAPAAVSYLVPSFFLFLARRSCRRRPAAAAVTRLSPSPTCPRSEAARFCFLVPIFVSLFLQSSTGCNGTAARFAIARLKHALLHSLRRINDPAPLSDSRTRRCLARDAVESDYCRRVKASCRPQVDPRPDLRPDSNAGP